jgi:hypothetical protein
VGNWETVIMTIADKCPKCGKEPKNANLETQQETIKKGNMAFLDENIYCECGTQVGGFSHPMKVNT